MGKLLLFFIGVGYFGKWMWNEVMSVVFILCYGILFEDWKGLCRFVMMMDDINLNKNIDGLRFFEEYGEWWVYIVLGCF